MVIDIAKAVGKLEQVDVLATDTRGNSFEYEGVHFLSRSLLLYISAIFSCISLSSLINLRKDYKMANCSFIRLVYYWLMTGYLKQVVKNGHYDIVHIHGCSFATDLWMQVCKKCNQIFIVTLHGLNSFSDTVCLEPAGKKYERDFLKRVTEGEIPITVISTGMKKLIEKTYSTPDCKNITVVCNSFNCAVDKDDGLDIRKLYGIAKNAKVLLYVGNISFNKNQAQVARAFSLLPEETQNNTYVLFCGADYSKDGLLQSIIENSPNKSHLILCGAVDKNDMSSYYRSADGVVLLSYAEGFGLSLVEGMHFGLPCVMHQDLDAFEDIYDEAAVVAVKGREDADVAKAINELISKDWDKYVIMKCSKKFESDTMAKAYISVCKKIAAK